jgi:hypothetical protein
MRVFRPCGVGYQVACPECGMEQTHTVAVGSLRPLPENGGEGVDAYPGTQVIGVTTGRRAAVAIVMECEDGAHRFAVVVRQHKGDNLFEIHSPFTQDANADASVLLN